MFPIRDKVALVTGGSSDFGLYSLKELLRNGLRAVTIVDIDSERGEQALEEVAREFGQNKAIFVKTDVSIKNEMEAAFRKTVEVFKNLDIVVNSALLADDTIWEREIAVNINGTIHGCLLAWEYLPKYRSGNEAVIVNVCSITGLIASSSLPIYTATRHAMVGLSKCIGTKQHYKRTKVKVVTICPGVTNISPVRNFKPDCCLPSCKRFLLEDACKMIIQEPDIVAKALAQAVASGENGSFWIVNDNTIQNIPELPEVLKLSRTHTIISKI